MAEERNPRLVRTVEDAQADPAEEIRYLRAQLEQKTAELDEMSTSMRALPQDLLSERRSGTDAATALRDERNLLAVHLRNEKRALQDLLDERAESAAKINALQQELRLAWRKVEMLEELLQWERQPLRRRAFGRRPVED